MGIMECEKCGKMFLYREYTDTGSFVRSGKSLAEELQEEHAIYCPECKEKQQSKTLAIPI